MRNFQLEEIVAILIESSGGSEEKECEDCGMKTCICEWLKKSGD